MLVVIWTHAEDPPADWRPPGPPDLPEHADWVQTTSGEWLRGELLVMYKDELTFDSKEFDEVTIDWEDVHQIRTARTMAVGLTGRRVVVGQLFVQGEVVRVIGDDDQRFGREEIISIAAGGIREVNYWDFDLSLGANYRTGNTNQVETTSSARVRRRTPTKRLILDWLAAYNVTDDVVTSNTQRASVTWDLFLSRRFFLTPVFAEWYSDPFQNIDGKYALSVAAGYRIVDTSAIEWQVSGGPGAALTRFDEVPEGEPPEETDATFVIGTVYEHEIARRIDFAFDYRATFTDESSGSYLHHLVASVEFELTRRLDFDVVWVWDRIENPRAGAGGTVPEQDDNRLSFLLGVRF
jgi:hypothetical protein